MWRKRERSSSAEPGVSVEEGERSCLGTDLMISLGRGERFFTGDDPLTSVEGGERSCSDTDLWVSV